EVVEQHEQRLAVQVRGNRVPDRRPGLLVDAKRPSKRGQHKLGISERRERHPEHPVGKRFGRVGRCLQRETGLSGAARAGQRQDANAVSTQQLDDLGELSVAAKERRRWYGQIRSVERLERWKVSGSELGNALGSGQILESVLPQIAEGRIDKRCR